MDVSGIQRMTRQRRVILDTLRQSTAHPTADELHALVRQTLPHISLGTVYRNLDILVRCGMVLKLDIGGGPSRYDGNVHWHDHIRCKECGRLDDTEPIVLQLDKERALRKTGYRVTAYRLELEGICPHCLKKLKKNSGMRTEPIVDPAPKGKTGSKRGGRKS